MGLLVLRSDSPSVHVRVTSVVRSIVVVAEFSQAVLNAAAVDTDVADAGMLDAAASTPEASSVPAAAVTRVLDDASLRNMCSAFRGFGRPAGAGRQLDVDGTKVDFGVGAWAASAGATWLHGG